MAADKDFSDIIDKLSDMRGGLGQLSDLMESTQQVSDGLLASFRDFATAGSSNTLWNAVSRFSSGIFPGFWSMQNKIRAVAVYMQYVEKKQKEQIKKEAEIARTINKQTEARVKSAATLALLNKDNLTTLDYIKLAEDDYFKSLTARLGKEEAKVKYAKQFNAQMSESLSREVELAHEVSQRIQNQKTYQDMYMRAGKANVKNLTEILYFNEKVNTAENDRLELEQQRKDLGLGVYGAKSTKGKPGTPYKSQETTHPEEVKMFYKLTEAIEKLTEEEIAAKSASEHIQKRSGVKVNRGSVSVTKGEEETEREAEQGDTLKEMIKKKMLRKFDGIAKTIKAIGISWAIMKKKGVWKSLGGFLKNGLAVLGSILLWIAMAGVIVFLIIQSGIIGHIQALWEWFTSTDLFSNIVDSLKGVWDGVVLIFSGFWGIFEGLFTGNGRLIWESLGKIVDGLWKIAWGGVQLVLGILLGLVGINLEKILEKWSNFKDWLNDFTGGYGDLILHWLKYGVMAMIAWMMAGTHVTGGLAVAAIVGTGLANMPAKKPMAGGGRVNMGGNILVGEAGPEIVSLPTNSFVTPAQQSRGRMGNNISVNVNGRVGASDSELNEIARKIGQKINREMNKYGSSGYRA